MEPAARVEFRSQWEAPVRAWMTPAARLVTVDPLSTLDEADQRARRAGVHHLLVFAADTLVGIACLCDLEAPHAGDDLVTSRMSGPVRDISPAATLADARAAMDHHRVGCLPVIGGTGFVLGVITRGDLDRAGCR